MAETFGSEYASLHVRVSNKAAFHLYTETLGYQCVPKRDHLENHQYVGRVQQGLEGTPDRMRWAQQRMQQIGSQRIVHSAVHGLQGCRVMWPPCQTYAKAGRLKESECRQNIKAGGN